MGFFGGPSQADLMQIAQGVASTYLQCQQLRSLDQSTRAEVEKGMRDEGLPTQEKGVLNMVVDYVNTERLGFWKRGQFFTMIYGSLISFGTPKDKAFQIREDIRKYYNIYGKR